MSPGKISNGPIQKMRTLLFCLTWSLSFSIGCGDGGSGSGLDIPIIGQNDKGIANPNNRPPVLKHIGDRTVAVGETLSIVMDGFDPDSDPLNFAVFGNLPEGAKFEKNEGRFDWTPTTTQAPVFLTFQVSDGFETDRETVKLTTTLEKQNLPPVFQKVDDQVVVAGTNYNFQLQATDPNGDELLFGAQGSLPEGSQIVPEVGLFQWSVPPNMVGSTVLIVFTVTDGIQSALMEVRFIVSVDGSGPSPPVFGSISTLEVEAGKTLNHQIDASDPNNDILSFSLQGAPPLGLTLHPSSGTINWTPAISDAGKTYTIQVVVTDGTFSAYLDLNISVYAPGTNTGTCTNDSFELNNNAQQASLVQPGVISGLSICDTPISPIDTDWFALQLTPGLSLTATVTWNPSGQEINVRIAQATDNGVTYLTVGEGSSGSRSANYVVTEPGTYYVVVFGMGPEKYSEEYSLSMVMENPGTQCVQDNYEFASGNDTASNAFFLSSNVGTTTIPDLTICPGDEDWFEFTGICGQNATVSINFNASAVDLDLYIFDSTNPVMPLDQSAGVLVTESVSLQPINKTSTYLAKVKGFPSSTQGNYELTLNIVDGPTCWDDGNEPNDNQLQAIPISSGVAVVDQKICCNEDYFIAQVQAGELIEAVVVFDGAAGSVDLISGSLGTTVATQSNTAVTVSWTATVSGPVYIRLYGAPLGTTYSIGTTFGSTGPSLCTPFSCPLNQICDPSVGCVSDFCVTHNDCPTDFLCTQYYCVDNCAQSTDCRTSLGYECKTLMGGKYCGLAGDGDPGAACLNFTDCDDAADCLLQAYGGYCAVNNCWSNSDCPFGTHCYIEGEFSGYCAQSCFIDLDCRTSEGYSCTLLSSFGGSDKWVCLH